MNFFIKLLNSAGRTLSIKSREATKWFRDSVSTVISRQKTDPNKVFNKDARPQVGRMYMFVYDAKHKDTLPYFDMYPMVIPIEFYGDGFLGINFHYLPPLARAQLLDALMDISNNNKYDDTTKLNISYKLLRASATRYKGFESCVKRYLFAHVRSSFHYVSPADWDKAVVMPLQKWHINPNKKYAGSPPY